MSDQEPEDQTEYELERTRKVVAAAMAEQIAANEKAAVREETAAEETAEETVDPWDGWTVDDLKTALSDADLKVSGNRDELIARLNDAGIAPN